MAPSTLAPPSFPTDFVPEAPKAEEGATSTAIPDKLTFSFYLPHATVNSKQQVLHLASSFAFSRPAISCWLTCTLLYTCLDAHGFHSEFSAVDPAAMDGYFSIVGIHS